MSIQRSYPYCMTGRDFEGFCAVMAATAESEAEKQEWMNILGRIKSTGNVNVAASIYRPIDFSGREHVSEEERQRNVARETFQRVVERSGYRD